MSEETELSLIIDQNDPIHLVAEEEWCAMPAHLSNLSSTVTLSTSQARVWALTLEAKQVPFRLEAIDRGWQLLVPPFSFPVALDELRHFEEENRNWPPPLPPASPETDNFLVTLSVLFLVAIFHNITQLDGRYLHFTTSDWISYGNADAWAIRNGEVWRAVTALTLHADGLHLLGNLTIGGFFIVFLCRNLGSGLAWSVLLASGTFGNLINAWVQSPRHHSVGASTTVFGAVGLLAALNLLRDRNRLRGRWYLPLAAALALLALLGSEGENTDIGAHLFGFAVGIGLGLLTGYLLEKYDRPGPWLNFLLSLGSATLVTSAWWAALHFS